MMSRVQTSRTRLWPKATELSYWPMSRAPCGNEQILAGRAVIDRFRHLGGDLAGQIGADAGDERGRDDGARLHNIRARPWLQPVRTDGAFVRSSALRNASLAVLHVLSRARFSRGSLERRSCCRASSNGSIGHRRGGSRRLSVLDEKSAHASGFDLLKSALFVGIESR
jgi:hypothetical protein